MESATLQFTSSIVAAPIAARTQSLNNGAAARAVSSLTATICNQDMADGTGTECTTAGYGTHNTPLIQTSPTGMSAAIALAHTHVHVADAHRQVLSSKTYIQPVAEAEHTCGVGQLGADEATEACTVDAYMHWVLNSIHC
jgi:hypothetical protein